MSAFTLDTLSTFGLLTWNFKCMKCVAIFTYGKGFEYFFHHWQFILHMTLHMVLRVCLWLACVLFALVASYTGLTISCLCAQTQMCVYVCDRAGEAINEPLNHCLICSRAFYLYFNLISKKPVTFLILYSSCPLGVRLSHAQTVQFIGHLWLG